MSSLSTNPTRRWRAIAASATVLVISLIAGLGIGHRLISGESEPFNFGGSDRFRVHVSSDKPFYRPGEVAYFRAVMLHAFDGTPFGNPYDAAASIEIIGPKGDRVMQGSSTVADSTIGVRWPIDEGLAGGIYKIKVTPPDGSAPGERKFEIRAFRAPRIRAQIEFAAKGYGPEDWPTASAKITRAEGGVPTDAEVTAIARVDGVEVHREVVSINQEGIASVRFQLPKTINSGEGTLAFVVNDGGNIDTVAKTIPILLQKLDVAVYPEGGDLIAGLSNRIYIEAATPWGEPADMTGHIVDETGRAVGVINTSHEGRGRATFVPEAGKRYRIEVIRPSGITTPITMPEVKASGVTILTNADAYPSGEAMAVTVGSTSTRRLRVSLFRHERELSSAMVSVEAGATAQTFLTPPLDASGVLRLTVFDEDDRPLAERLVFRRPTQEVNIQLEAGPDKFGPGDFVKVSVRTTDHRGRPVAATLGVVVTDDAVLEMVETRRKAPRLPAMVLLEGDVSNLEDAHVYLSDAPDAPQQVDLLLATQGWRRFAHVSPKEFIEKHQDKAKRALAYREPVGRWGEPMIGPNSAFGFGGGAGGGDRPTAGAVAEREVNGGPEDGGAAEDQGDGGGGLRILRSGGAARSPDAQPAQEMGEVAPDSAEEPRDRADDDGVRGINGRLARERRQAPRHERMLTVREFAHLGRVGRKEGEREDFTETLYFNAGLKTNELGEANFTFRLSDSITSFRVMTDAFTTRGALGEADLLVESRQPFSIEPKLPLEVTIGDLVEIPVGIVNNTESMLNWQIMPTFGEFGRIERDGIHIPEFLGQVQANQRTRYLFPVRVGASKGNFTISFTATAGPYTETVSRSVNVVPFGFPQARGAGGMIDSKSDNAHAITIPDTVVPGSVRTSIKVYPTPMANLTQALEALVREPYGCFEQASSVVYPMVMAQQYFRSHTGVDPALIARTGKHIESGYRRLTGYEVAGGGFEWFGHAPAHEALTAYGVLQFQDMSEVFPVDKELLSRTRKWLLDRRDGKGGFNLNNRNLDSFGGAPEHITRAYIVWSLTESGSGDQLATELTRLKSEAETSTDPYFIGLIAAALHNTGEHEIALTLLRKITNNQKPDGTVVDANTTITRSMGDALLIETTSVAVLGWLKDPQFAGNVERAMQWLVTRCKDGKFGSTQSTILALKAIVAYDKSRSTPRAPGILTLMVDGAAAGAVPFTTDTKGTISLPDVSHMLLPGRHELRLVMQDGSPMPYSVQVDYNADTPASSPACQIEISAAIEGTGTVGEGETVEIACSIRNTAETPQGMATAVFGIPGGLEVRHDRLRELTQAGTISFYEVRGREVVVYLRNMAANQQVDFRLDCVAALPGSYEGPASRGYLYYADEHKHWTPGVRVRITAAE